MSLIVNNVISSNINIGYSYLETDEIFGYVVTAKYTINVSDTQFEAGGGVLLSGRSAIRSAYERQNITARIGGDDFVNGLITSLSFEQSNLVGSEVATITIEERKSLNDYSSKTFAKYIPSPHLLESFSEIYTFSRQDSTYSYNRDISIQYAQDAGIDFLDNAKLFLSNYYHANRPSLGYYEDGIAEDVRFNSGFNGQLSESIDLINLSVSLKESLDSSLVYTGDNYSRKVSEKYSQSDRGYISKQISIELTALRYDAQNIIEAAMAEVIDEIISEERSTYGTPYNISKGISKDSKKGSVNLSFSTDPNLSQEDITTYTCSKSKEGAFILYTLNVRYKSNGKNLSDRYYNTITLWTTEKDNNETKVSSLFPEANGVIYEKERNCSISRSQGEVSESISFITNDVYNTSSLPEGIIKYELTLSKTNKIKRHEKIVDFYDLREKLIVSDYDELGQATVTATAVAEPSYGINHAKDFLNTKNSDIVDKLDASVYYLTGDETTIDLSNGTTTRVISFIIA